MLRAWPGGQPGEVFVGMNPDLQEVSRRESRAAGQVIGSGAD
ncbi:MAG: hypothetical protein K0Q68_300 [Moraxellaceae bacterium]|jgi:hypothetical protein|nr:hypothetical protein [Moraxellaceae bacterium]